MVKKKKDGIIQGHIVRMDEAGDLEIDLTRLSAEELRRHIETLDAQLKRKQLELAELQITEAQEHLYSRHRALLVEKYIRQIAELDRVTPGGLKSVQPSEGDDPELVAEAWRAWVYQRGSGGSRFG